MALVELPDTLPAQIYLLAFDPDARRLTGHSQLGLLVRGAALAELLLRGHLYDEAGMAKVNARQPLPTDPVLLAVLNEVAESRPRSWQHWVARHAWTTRRAVAHQLAAGEWIELRHRQVLGLLPLTTVVLLQPYVVKQLAHRVHETLRETTPVAEVDARDAALVALAAAGDLFLAIPQVERRAHQQRISDLAEPAGPVVRAVRKAWQQQQDSAASGG